MSRTHGGGKSKRFRWTVARGVVVIKNENGLVHRYTLPEILRLLSTLHETFGDSWIPLANNVEWMYHGTERAGVGSTIYGLCPGDTFHAQGASYLGVVLEEAGILQWNGKSRGIAWRFVSIPNDGKTLNAQLERKRSGSVT